MTPAEALKQALGAAVEEVVDEGPNPFVRVKAESIVEASRTLRDQCGVEMLHLISGVDYADRMEVVYHFATLGAASSADTGAPASYPCVKVTLPRQDPVVPTLCSEWRSANWMERETWDLLGIRFEGHPHHYRILCPEDWVGHPLRKDYEFPTEYHGIDCTE